MKTVTRLTRAVLTATLLVCSACSAWTDKSNYWNTPAGQASILQAVQNAQAMSQRDYEFSQNMSMERARLLNAQIIASQPVKVQHSGSIDVRIQK
jgi:predicted anti-sigma-YlaC factor YlaD